MYKINISKQAAQDLENHYLHIKEQSPIDAQNWYLNIFNKIQTLKEYPKRCPLAVESYFYDYEIRNLIIGNFRVLYRVKKQIVQILHIKHGKQDRVKL